MADRAVQRKNMVESQIRPSDVTDRRITAAMQDVARERYLPVPFAALAYMDEALAVAPGRSLMAPRTFARLVQLASIQSSDTVLIVGALAGYSAAVISRLANSVFALESGTFAAAAGKIRSDENGASNVSFVTGPLENGWAAAAPYDVIFVEGSIELMPPAFAAQIKASGRLVGIATADGVGRAFVMQQVGRGLSAALSRHSVFDASAATLPGFEQPKAFTF